MIQNHRSTRYHTQPMCSRKAPRHPMCHHAVSEADDTASRCTDLYQAHGTALEGFEAMRCSRAPRDGLCSTVHWTYYDVRRGYCDRCIVFGELVSQRRGLDPGHYSRCLGVSLVELRDANMELFTMSSSRVAEQLQAQGHRMSGEQ